MAQIKFTSLYLKNSLLAISNEIFGGNYGFGGITGDDGISSPTPYNCNRLVLYKGVPPVEALMANVSLSPNRDTGIFRSTDLLLSVDYRNLFEGLIDGAFSFKESPFFIASASGTATWAALYAWTSSSRSCAVYLDVSDLNGNGLLKLPSAEIVSGDRYSIKPMKLVFPNEFSY